MSCPQNTLTFVNRCIHPDPRAVGARVPRVPLPRNSGADNASVVDPRHRALPGRRFGPLGGSPYFRDRTLGKMRRVVLILAFFLASGAGTGSGRVAAQAPPDESWRSFETSHFRVTFPEGMEGLARRAASRAERAFETLSAVFLDPPDGLIELLLTDHTDSSNGFASAVPFNRIVAYARPPMEGATLSHFDDWMEVVITHELVHVFQLDHTGPIGSLIRSVLGRWESGWPTFPGFDLPLWTTEGLATYYESSLTGAGRLRGSFVDMVLRTAVLEDGLERLDQITGSSPNWPAGSRVYVYGASFFDHLSETYGEGRLGAFAAAVARQWIPYRLNAGAMDAFGVSFSDAWEGWRLGLGARFQELADSLADTAPITAGEPVSSGGRYALFPTVSPDGSSLAFARSDGRTDLQIHVSAPDGTNDRKLLRLNNLSDFVWLPDGSLVVSRLDFADPFRLRTDLVHVDPDGHERGITSNARVDHPTPSPDGRTLVAVQSSGGTNRLVRVDLETGEIFGLTPFAPDVHWSFPAWSPDGRWIAASRWSPGAFYDVVVMDPDGRVVQRITNDRSVDQAPTWSPDGRWLLWSSDRSGIPNIYATEIDPVSAAPGPLRQVTNILGGTAYPSVGPDGRWIYFSSYHKTGWIIERIPFDPATWFEPHQVKPGFASGGLTQDSPDGTLVDAEVGPYRAFATLWPHYWEPTLTARSRRPMSVGGLITREVLGPALGARTSGSDLVGRHRYGIDARFRRSGQTDAAVGYTYAGWGNPSVGLSAIQVHDVDGPFLVQTTAAVPSTLYVSERERRVRASGALVRRRVRSSTSLSFSVAHIWQQREFLDQNAEPSAISIFRPNRRLGEARIGASFSTARAFAYSTSGEAGVRMSIQSRVRRELSVADSLRGSSRVDRSLKEVTGTAQAYQSFSGPGFSDHVLAARASIGVAGGPGADRFHFSVGGAQGRSERLTGAELFGGSPLFFPVRGYFEGRRTGRYAWSASGEYRFPLINVHRGIGLLPVHMDRVSGSIFFDAGNAWGDAGPLGGVLPNARGTALASVGAEVQTSITALFSTRMFFRLGAARRLNSGKGVAIYLRLGSAF